MPKTDPFSLLGITPARVTELNTYLRQIQEAEDEPYAAMDAMMGQTQEKREKQSKQE